MYLWKSIENYENIWGIVMDKETRMYLIPCPKNHDVIIDNDS